ncbi:hypothetical protein CPLU01_00115 [Colletotrichum plurivorum]|uniref:Uncharacterized protein n=1 Tax=Colletotrichum plurivorum TaxID=2175906 RepID=A0A8H6NSX1_9PEZI|nr:hypothetical protein CPLU01_00115 [Colletotrichum plurivorum]
MPTAGDRVQHVHWRASADRLGGQQTVRGRWSPEKSPTPNAGAIGGHSLPSTREIQIQGMFQRPTVLSHHHHHHHNGTTTTTTAPPPLIPLDAHGPEVSPSGSSTSSCSSYTEPTGDSTVSGFSNHTTAIEIGNAQH